MKVGELDIESIGCSTELDQYIDSPFINNQLVSQSTTNFKVQLHEDTDNTDGESASALDGSGSNQFSPKRRGTLVVS